MIRVDIILRAAAGQPNYRIAKQLKISRNTVKLWRQRFVREGMDGLKTRPIPGRPRKHSAEARANAGAFLDAKGEGEQAAYRTA